MIVKLSCSHGITQMTTLMKTEPKTRCLPPVGRGRHNYPGEENDGLNCTENVKLLFFYMSLTLNIKVSISEMGEKE